MLEMFGQFEDKPPKWCANLKYLEWGHFKKSTMCECRTQ